MDTNKKNEMNFNNPIVNLFNLVKDMYKQYLPQDFEKQFETETPLKKGTNFKDIVRYEKFNDIEMRVTELFTYNYLDDVNTVEIEAENENDYSKLTGKQIKDAITEILDKYLFDVRTRRPQPTEYKLKIDFYNILDYIDICELTFAYNFENDRFEGSVYVELDVDFSRSNGLDEYCEFDVYYNEFEKLLHPADDEAKRILDEFIEDVAAVSADYEEDKIEDAHNCKESYNDLDEPNDTCVNCKEFKNCWLGSDKSENENSEDNDTSEDDSLVELVEVPVPEKTYAQSLFDELSLDKKDPMEEVYYSAFLNAIYYLLDNKMFDKINYNHNIPESVDLSIRAIIDEAKNYHNVDTDTLHYHIDLNKLINEIKSNYGFTNVTLCFNAEDKLEKMRFKLV